MTLYLAGNLVGRLFAAYLIVWIIVLLFARFDWRKAFRDSRRWYAVVGVIVLFVGGLATFEPAGGV